MQGREDLYVARIEAVFFDVGEVLVDETREYGTWADWLGVPRHTFSAVFGAVIAQGKDYRETFQVFEPGFDLAVERERRAAVGQPETFAEENLYSDVRPCLRELKGSGLRIGLAGNQTARVEKIPLRRVTSLPIIYASASAWSGAPPATISRCPSRARNAASADFMASIAGAVRKPVRSAADSARANPSRSQ
ncbi:hypothetical protein L3Q67_25585 [Saccharothrix sp. AJ9571]|nr:hypothetical protein L3Q67_25585 [Saccharothrix sp. AJ9571]